ncbi:histidine kinase, partial [Polaribacter reichenbachii]
TSSVISVKNDSILKLNFENVYKLYQKQDYIIALTNLLELLEKSKELESNYWIYKCNFLLGEIYRKTNKFEKSLLFYKQSLAIVTLPVVEKSNSRFSDLDYVKTLFKVGISYHSVNISIDMTNKLSKYDSIKLAVKKKSYIDSALLTYKKIEQLPELNPQIENLKGAAYNNISNIYEEDSVFTQAEYYAKKAINIHKKNNDHLKTATSLNILANISLSQKKYQKAKALYSEAIDLIKNNNNSNAIRTKADLYYNLAWAMRNLEEFEAYDFQEKSFEIEEDIRDKEFKGIIEEISAKYDVDVAKRNVRQEEENKRLKTQRTYSIFGIILLLVIIILGYWLVINNLQQKNLALNLSKTKLIQDQNIEKLKSESQVRVLNATIDGKESERKQIAETLHDSVSALLSSANLHLQATRKQFNGATPVEIDKTQEIILEASHKIRDLSHTLISSVLLKFGLTFAIKEIAEKFSNSELNIETEINNVERYHQSFEIKVYNIVQEFVNNILKHSKAGNALIELEQKQDKLFIIISDDGIGFDKTKITSKDGLGLNQIDARIQMMKGKFKIDSSKNNGTQILVELPVLEKEEPSLV